MDSGLVGQYPQGLGSMPMDLQRLYASSAPAAVNRSLHAQDPYGLPQPSTDHNSLAGAPLSHQLPAASPAGLGADPLNPIDPQTWAWGAAPARLGLPNTDLFSLNSPMEYMMIQQELGAASLPAGTSGHRPVPYGGEDRYVTLSHGTLRDCFAVNFALHLPGAKLERLPCCTAPVAAYAALHLSLFVLCCKSVTLLMARTERFVVAMHQLHGTCLHCHTLLQECDLALVYRLTVTTVCHSGFLI